VLQWSFSCYNQQRNSLGTVQTNWIVKLIVQTVIPDSSYAMNPEATEAKYVCLAKL
jgi:hypothetical protein